MASSSAGAPALKYGDIKAEATSPGEVKGLIIKFDKDNYLGQNWEILKVVSLWNCSFLGRDEGSQCFKILLTKKSLILKFHLFFLLT